MVTFINFIPKIKISIVMALLLTAVAANADEPVSDQVSRQKVVDNGGSGLYKAVVVSEKTLPDFTVYRPWSIQGAAKREGALPILIWCNGACSDSSQGYERMLNEIASHGYVVVAIGAMKLTDNEREDGGSSETMVTDAITWLRKQERTSTSQYYHAIDVMNIALAGHSCGGAQAIANCANARVKTLLIMNAGMGGMSMGGASPQSLKNLHCPIIYMTGGTGDVAYANAQTDFGNISKVPVTWADLPTAGHGGTYWNAGGGEFGNVALKWMDWRLKGYSQNARLFLKPELRAFPSWNISHRNYPDEDPDAPFLPIETETDTVFERARLDSLFAFGADVSLYTQMSQSGQAFFNREGQRTTMMPLLRQAGMNSVRLRLFVNPSDNISNATYVRTQCMQAKGQNLDVMLNLHYSDTWANAGVQTKPAAWAKHTTEQLVKDIRNHTLTTVQRIRLTGAKLRWVQMGNEVDNGFLWDEGRLTTRTDDFATFINSAYNAIHEVDSSIQALIHVSECIDANWLTQYFDTLKEHGAQFDAIGLSAYPTFYNLTTANFIKNVAANVSMLKERYGVPVYIVETGYYNDRPLEANQFLCDLMSALIDAGGAGLFYWEPALIDSYTLGAWNPLTNQPSIALDAFQGVRHKPYDSTAIKTAKAEDIEVKFAGNTMRIKSGTPLQRIQVYTATGQLVAEHDACRQQHAYIDIPATYGGHILLIRATTDAGKHVQVKIYKPKGL